MKPLSGRFAKIVYDGEDWAEHYADKFSARRAIMLHAVQRGWTLPDCRTHFLNQDNPGSALWLTGEDERPLTKAESAKRIGRDFEAARAYSAASPGYRSAADARARIGELIALADQWDWKRSSGRTDRDVLRFIHKAATRIGCDLINFSTRDVAIGAGVSQTTAGKAIRRLMACGWLDKKEAARAGLAPLFKLTSPARDIQVRTTDSYDLHPGESYMSQKYAARREPDHEVWVRLGKAAMDLHTALEDTPISAREVARRAGAADRTARLNLPVLEACGLAAREGKGWVRIVADLDSMGLPPARLTPYL